VTSVLVTFSITLIHACLGSRLDLIRAKTVSSRRANTCEDNVCKKD